MTGTPSQNADLTGELLEGRYRIDRLLGQGGMGKVYEATHVTMERRVAIKVLNQEMTRNEQALKRFNREMKVSSQIDHPNSIQVFDYGQLEDGRCYLVMEFLEGSTLSDIIRTQGAISVMRTVAIARQILMALGASHQKGIVHRDLKPDNVMVLSQYGNADFVKVLDFGIAGTADKDVSKLTVTGTVMGTPYYMSPEQASGVELDHRSDLYSLGVVMYEMATGKVPFDGESMVSLLVKHVQEPPIPPNAVKPGCVPVNLEALIMRLLAKKPDERPRDAGQTIELLNEVDDAAEGSASDAVAPAADRASTIPESRLPVEGSPHDVTLPGAPLPTGDAPAAENRENTRLSPAREAPVASNKTYILVAAIMCAIAGAVFFLTQGDSNPSVDSEQRTEAKPTQARTLDDGETTLAGLVKHDVKPADTSSGNEQTPQQLRTRLTDLYTAQDIPPVPVRCQTKDPVVIGAILEALTAHSNYVTSQKQAKPGDTEALEAVNRHRVTLEAMQKRAATSAEYWTMRALYTGLDQGAAEWLTQAIELCDSWAYAMSRQGRVFESNQELNQASVAYGAASELAPKWLPPRQRRLLVAGKKADWPQALEALSALLSLAPSDPLARAFVKRYGPRLEELGPKHPATQAIDAMHPNWRNLGAAVPQ